MHTTIVSTCLSKINLLLSLLLLSTLPVLAQNGTYERNATKGAYGVISFQKTGNLVKAEIFTWWNSSNSQTGSYFGQGTLKNDFVYLKSDENEPECKVTLHLVQGKIKATFSKCSTDHLTEDFNGTYTKISDAVAGDYQVIASKAYFYKAANTASKLKAYVVQGDKVTLDMQNMAANTGNWVFVSYMNKADKETTGFMPLSALKRIN
ncbi:hypothetical protein MUGA111182_06665 [Mucilaginibacter galii]|uniref:SH3 domain-containing protein n=1 Tax=Mucilaginibacter galii TaxID=2005073 RepID=A0A917N270_9SPHI|nr:hypothetical protein [Mucilaginibacter galii]GGI51665.1 hypothetical protein GCM10011425_28770 [Mucilaginibacter galii]